jgi:hypothetical protein
MNAWFKNYFKNMNYNYITKLLTVLFIIFFGVISPVFAGGGRYNLESYSSPGYTGASGVYIQAWITNQNQSSMSVGEKAEFRIQNPRVGDRCETTTAITTQNGQIFGVCFASQVGQMLVYVHSFDKNEDSSPVVLYFNNKPTPTPTKVLPTKVPPTKQPTPKIEGNQISPAMNNGNKITPTLEPTIPAVTQTPQNEYPQNRNFGQKVFDLFNSIISKLFGK